MVCVPVFLITKLTLVPVCLTLSIVNCVAIALVVVVTAVPAVDVKLANIPENHV
jgi:hypothetical protein